MKVKWVGKRITIRIGIEFISILSGNDYEKSFLRMFHEDFQAQISFYFSGKLGTI